jgi:hypothetical protein
MYILNLRVTAPCIPAGDCRRFLGTYCLIFCSEDGEVIFLPADAEYLTDQTMQQKIRQYVSSVLL